MPSAKLSASEVLAMRQLAGLGFDEIRWRLRLGAAPAETAAYGHVDGLRVVRGPDHPAVVYLGEDNRVALIYLPNAALEEVDADELRQSLGPGITARSRQRGATLEVHAPEGLAFSFRPKDGGVGFVEIFTPRPAEDYMRDFYMPPEKRTE